MSALGPANVFADDEVDRILEEIIPKKRRHPSPTSLRNYALVKVLYRTGMRCSEALGLEISDLRIEQNKPVIVVRKGKTASAARILGVPDDLLGALQRWLLNRKGLPGTAVFCTLRGAPLDSGYVREMIARKGRQAGITRAHPHAFRATLATELAREGCPLPLIRDVLGHVSLAHTNDYLQRTWPEKAVDALIDRVAIPA